MNKLLKTCKHDYYKERIKECKGYIRKIYELTSDAVNERKSKNNQYNTQIKEFNDNFPNITEMTSCCNDYVVNIGLKMFRDIKQPKEHIVTHFHNINSMFLKSVNEYDELKQINSF